MTMLKGIPSISALLIAAMAVSACSSLNTKVGGVLHLDTDLTLRLVADADINPDDKNRASPLFLRMYELKSTKQFERANFIDLYERDSEVLGADMLGKQTLKRLKPGDERKDKFVLKPETHYVGLFAEFLQYKNAKFKLIIPVSPTNVIASSGDVQISANTIRNPNEKVKPAAASGTGNAR